MSDDPKPKEGLELFMEGINDIFKADTSQGRKDAAKKIADSWNLEELE